MHHTTVLCSFVANPSVFVPIAALAGVGWCGSLFHTKIARSARMRSQRHDSKRVVAPGRYFRFPSPAPLLRQRQTTQRNKIRVKTLIRWESLGKSTLRGRRLMASRSLALPRDSHGQSHAAVHKNQLCDSHAVLCVPTPVTHFGILRMKNRRLVAGPPRSEIQRAGLRLCESIHQLSGWTRESDCLTILPIVRMGEHQYGVRNNYQ